MLRNMIIKLLEIINKDKIAKAFWGKKIILYKRKRKDNIMFFIRNNSRHKQVLHFKALIKSQMLSL